MTTSTPVGARPLRARLALLALGTTALCTGLAAPALASSPHPNRDANGVDLTTGEFSLELPVASIGSGTAELPLIIYSKDYDNWTGFASRQTSTIAGNFITIDLGPSYDTFKSTDGYAKSIRGTGATLTFSGNQIIYTALDGTTLVFGDPIGGGAASGFCDASSATNCTRLPISISRRNGMTVTFDWQVHELCSTPSMPDEDPVCTYSWRLGGVANSASYAIGYSYDTDSVPFNQHPGAAWFRRTGAILSGGGSSRSVSYAYPTSNAFTVTTPGGKTWRIINSGSLITGVRRPSASADTTVVSYSGAAATSVTKDGVTTSYNYGVSGSTATMVVTNALSQQSIIVSDLSKFRPTSVTDALNRTTNYTYDTFGQPSEITFPEGNKVQYSYDARGNVIEQRMKAKPSVGGTDIVTTAGYAASCVNASCNQPLWTRDANGNQTDYDYDAGTGLVTKARAPAPSSGANRPETRYGYMSVTGVSMLTSISTCQTGVAPTCVGTSDEVRQTIGYDPRLNVTSSTTASGDNSVSSTWTRAYDGVGNLLSADGPLSGSEDTTTNRWSADRELLGVISADPDGPGGNARLALKTTYNADGQPTTVETGTVSGTSDGDWAAFVSAQQATTTYDANARAVRNAQTAGGTPYSMSQTAYDSVGRLECVAQRMNPGAFGSLPASACSLGTAGSYGSDRITKASYDAVGHQTKVTTAYGTAEQSDDTAATYTPNGLVATATDAENNWTSYSYDGFDRLVTTSLPSSTKGAGASNSIDYEQLGYDAAGNVTSRRLRDGQTIGYSYDSLSRLVVKDVPAGVTHEYDVSYTYDLLGRLKRAQDANTHFTAFDYDALGRRISEQSNWTTRTSQYDAAGRRTRLTWGDGFYVSYDYDAVGKMTAIHENGATSGIGVLASFGYDGLGRRTSLTRGNGTVTSYGYDAASRLTALTQDTAGTAHDLSVNLSYNSAAQIVTRTASNDAYAWGGHANVNRSYAANGLNQYTAAGGTGYSYDARGNLTNSGSSVFSYTSENRLATGPGGYVMTYDPLGRFHWISNGSGLTWMQYDGTDLIEERDANGVQRRYVFGPGTDEPLVWYEGSGTSDRRWLHADERGSIVAVTNAAGTATFSNSYDEYGAPAATNIGRFQYTGQAWVPELNMYYYKARIYSPSLGRFMQTDPIGYHDGLNWYNYVSGDPINYSDAGGTFGDQTVNDVSESSALMARLGGDEYEHVYAVDPSGGGRSYEMAWLNVSMANGGGPITGGLSITEQRRQVAEAVRKALASAQKAPSAVDIFIKDMAVTSRALSLKAQSRKGSGKDEWIALPIASRDSVWYELKMVVGGKVENPREGVWILKVTPNTTVNYRNSTQGGGKTLEFQSPYLNNRGVLKFRYSF